MIREDRDLLVMALTDDGLSAAEIAEKLGICTRTVGRIRRKTNEYVAPEPFSECEKMRARAMLDEGVSYTEVARTLGRSYNVVAKHVPGYPKWSKFDASNYAALVRSLNRLKNNVVGRDRVR